MKVLKNADQEKQVTIVNEHTGTELPKVKLPVTNSKKEEKQKPSETIKTLTRIRNLILKDRAFVERANSTGWTYFKGATRLCKLVKSSKGIILEINTNLPKELHELPGMEFISRAKASEKHLGTMKFLYRSQSGEHVKKIIEASLASFKDEEAKRNNTLTKENLKKTAK